MEKKIVSFLVSGRGSNFKEIATRIIDGTIPAQIGVVISNKRNAKALSVARKLSIPHYVVDSHKYYTRRGHEKAICKILQNARTDLVIAAGYMRILTPYIINLYQNRIMNIHPALLPAFPGIKAQKQALEYGVKISGCTVHFIDKGTDTGPIILQKAVEVLPDDTTATLSRRILDEEHHLFPEAVKLFCEDRIHIEGKKIIILEK